MYKKLTLIITLLLSLLACQQDGTPQQNQPPLAVFTATPSSGTVPLTVSFDASASSDPDGVITSYIWDYGDGNTSSGVSSAHTYTSTGTFNAQLTVTDNRGSSTSNSTTITVTTSTSPPDDPPPDSAGDISGTIRLSTTFSGQFTSLSNVSAPQAFSKLSPDSIIPGDLIVQFRPDSALQSQSSLQVQGITLLHSSSLLPGIQVLHAPGSSAEQTLELLSSLQQHPDVIAVMPNYKVIPYRVPNDEFYQYQWHYPAINLPEAWDITTGSAEVVVAVLDTGIIPHPDIVERLIPGYDFVTAEGRDNDPTDPGPKPATGYHGTHVAGTIGASTNNELGLGGVDWAARIQPVRVLGVETGSSVDVLHGALWAAGFPVEGVPDNPTPADILNLSLGSRDPLACQSIEQQVYQAIINAGKIVVMAAGNSNASAALYAPGNCLGPINVGASEFVGARAPYSNFGSRIDVMAPGGDVTVDLNQDTFSDGVLSLNFDDNTQRFTYEFLNGTSMAAPHVAGVAALMKALKPDLTNAEALTILKNTARPLSGSACNGKNRSNLTAADCGAGLIDAQAALVAVQNGTTPPPVAGSLSFTPNSLNFGTSLSEQTITLSNSGGSSVSWSILGFNSNPDNPAPIPDGALSVSVASGSLAAGGSENLSFSLNRDALTTMGTYQASLIFSTGDAQQLLPLQFTISDSTTPLEGDLSGTRILACFVLNDDCDPNRSRTLSIQTSGIDASYSIPELSSGNYVILAWKDNNDNNRVDAGDYFGFYSADGIGESLVSPPASDINFTVSEIPTTTDLKLKTAWLRRLTPATSNPYQP